MSRQLAIAIAPSMERSAPRGVDALRQRFANATCREEVEIDFLEDDLRQANDALAAISAYMARLERVLGMGWPSRQALTALARGGDPDGQAHALLDLIGDVRRRLSRLADRA